MNQSGLPTPPPQSSPSTSSAPAVTSPTAHLQQTNPSLDALLQQINASNNAVTLNGTLRAFAPLDIRETVLAGFLLNGQDPLSILDPRSNTLGVLYVLSARLNSSVTPQPSPATIDEFCHHFNPDHARLAPERLTLLAKGIVHYAEEYGNPKYAIKPIRDLLTRSQPTLSQLTPLHPIFLTACVSTRHFTAALSLLSTPITSIPSAPSDLTYSDHLVYHYAGGIALAALKRWAEAEEFFEICVSAPGGAVSAVQMDAMKKLVLVQLISKGTTVPLPRYTNPLITRIFKGTPYFTFAKHYPRQWENLSQLVQKERQFSLGWEKNLGLVTQALDRAPRWAIKKLTATYLTLGLGEIGRALKMDEGCEEDVRAIVLSMIESSEITAQISATGTVTFSDPPPAFTKADVDRVLREAQEQEAQLAALEKETSRSKEFLSKAVRNKEDSSWNAGPTDEEALYAAGLVGGSGAPGSWAEEAMFS